MKIYLFIFLVAASLNIVAQDAASKNSDPFGALHFKNGMAKVTIKALAVEFHEYAPTDWSRMLSEGDKKKFSLFYNEAKKIQFSNSGLSFIADNCNQLQDAQLTREAPFPNSYSGKVLRLTCLVFESVPKFKNEHYFVITDVKLYPEDNKTVASIKPLQYIDGLKYQKAYATYGNNPDFYTNAKTVLVMTANDEALLKNQDGSLMKFKLDKHVLTSNGYVDYFTGDAGTFELNINRIIYRMKNNDHQFGHLTVTLKNAKVSIDVVGMTWPPVSPDL